jgi:hypothetical protein
MRDSTFTFLASTRVWFSPTESVPTEIRKDLKKVRSFALSGGKGAAIELVFTGPISIYRGEPQLDTELGRRYIPMQVVAMEEYGYSRELDTTIKMTAKADSKNFGYTQPGGAGTIEVVTGTRSVLLSRAHTDELAPILPCARRDGRNSFCARRTATNHEPVSTRAALVEPDTERVQR